MNLDPVMLNTFREKIANPINWRHVHQVLQSCGPEDLLHPDGAGMLVDNLANKLGVHMTPAQRDHAVNWLVAQRINPRDPAHQMRMWKIVLGT